MMWLVAYDIADDKRRSKVSDLLEARGPRVQLSVFEIEVCSSADEQSLCTSLHELIDNEEDQIRLYPLGGGATRRRLIIGERRLQEHVAYLLA